MFYFKCYCQDIGPLDLVFTIFNTSIDNAQKFLATKQFEFNGSYESKDYRGKIYTVCSFLKHAVGDTKIKEEILLWRQKDSTTKFEMIEYTTGNQEIYLMHKKSAELTGEKISDKVEGNCISIGYRDNTFFKIFKQCITNGSKTYTIVLLNISIFSKE